MASSCIVSTSIKMFIFGTVPVNFSSGIFDKATEGGQEVCPHWSVSLHCSGSCLCIVGDAQEASYSQGHKKWECFDWFGSQEECWCTHCQTIWFWQIRSFVFFVPYMLYISAWYTPTWCLCWNTLLDGSRGCQGHAWKTPLWTGKNLLDNYGFVVYSWFWLCYSACLLVSLVVILFSATCIVKYYMLSLSIQQCFECGLYFNMFWAGSQLSCSNKFGPDFVVTYSYSNVILTTVTVTQPVWMHAWWIHIANPLQFSKLRSIWTDELC